MNPDYEGPDNLVALFRPMTMMIPDYILISEVIYSVLVIYLLMIQQKKL